MSKKKKYTAEQRFEAVRELLKSNRRVSIPQLASRFEVTEMTIHRDLKKLESRGYVKKTRGGAQPTQKMEFEFDFANRRATNQKLKLSIARKALEFVRPGDRLLLDTGTTTLELACLLKDYDDLTIITPSIAVASVLYLSRNITTTLLGGTIRHGSPDLTGAVAEAALELFAVDIAFQGADAIDGSGTIYNDDIRMARVDQKMRTRARKTYILCDSTKIGQTALAVNGKLSEVQALITDCGIGRTHAQNFKKMGIKIITVK